MPTIFSLLCCMSKKPSDNCRPFLSNRYFNRGLSPIISPFLTYIFEYSAETGRLVSGLSKTSLSYIPLICSTDNPSLSTMVLFTFFFSSRSFCCQNVEFSLQTSSPRLALLSARNVLLVAQKFRQQQYADRHSRVMVLPPHVRL